MKKFLPVLFGLLCLPAFAEVVPADYWEQTEESESALDEQAVASEDVMPVAPVVAPTASPRTTTARSATRAVAGVQGTRLVIPSRAISSRKTATSIRSMTTNTPSVSSRQSVSAPNTARAAITQTNTVTQPLYNSTTSRVGVRNNSIGSLSAARVASVAVSSTTSSTDDSTSMEEIAQMTDFCKAQYFSCMDNFCNVLDDNQGRCSCSANVVNYNKVEDALKQATEELQNVALQIQYLGLSKEDVVSLFTQTEAEAAMSGTQDTTQLKNDLDKIQKLVVDIKTSTNTSSGADFGIDFSSFNLSLDNGFDLSSLFGTSSTISNQRGAELYKTAAARCKTSVLDSCKSQGVDTAVVSNGYDMEIDKQCIVYERALDDSNTKMKRTVMNAKSVLQKARLAVAQSRNSYDMRGCISALDSCMQSDFVCGADYDSCLDPTGRYIVNGQIVTGSNSSDITTGLNTAWGSGTGNAWTGSGGLDAFISTNVGNFASGNMVGYLETKVGNINTQGLETGMCMSVLKKCQNYAFTGTNKRYEPKNDVVKEFLKQALTKIKIRQDNLVADFVSSCKADVQSCLVSNGAVVGDSGPSVGYISNAIANACNTVASTCAGASSSTGTAAELIYDIVCYTANDATQGTSTAWTVGTQTCKCPFGTTWSGATKTCNCPSGTAWNYETGACS